jgi:hypothetical protein
MPKPVILLTGQPGVGKTTVIKQSVSRLGDKAGGFYTREVRERGRRVGFEIVTLAGQTGWLIYRMCACHCEDEVRSNLRPQSWRLLRLMARSDMVWINQSHMLAHFLHMSQQVIWRPGILT